MIRITNKEKPLFTTTSWYSLLIAIISCAVVLYYNKAAGWITFAVLFVIWYPFLCYTFVSVKFYEDSIVVLRPLSFIHFKRTYLYTQIDYLRILSKYVSREPFDLLVYLKNEKKPKALPLPFSIKKEKKLEALMESKKIRIEREISE